MEMELIELQNHRRKYAFANIRYNDCVIVISKLIGQFFQVYGRTV